MDAAAGSLLPRAVGNGAFYVRGLPLKRALGLFLLLAAVVGCDHRIAVPEDAVVTYEDHASGRIAEVDDELAAVIRDTLRQPPDLAEKGVGMPLDTRKYLRVNNRSFQVLADSLVLLDNWGVRTWHLKDVEARLNSVLNDHQAKGGATGP